MKNAAQEITELSSDICKNSGFHGKNQDFFECHWLKYHRNNTFQLKDRHER